MITSTSIGTGGLGRFGNQLFTIAGVIGIATKSGQPFGFPKWRNYDNAMFGGEVTDFAEFFENPLPSIPEGLQFDEYGYFWGYRDIFLPTGNWSINAHMQSGKFFEHCLDTVRHYFRMKREPGQNNCVAIHYRAGDYIDDKRAYHPRQQREYYEKAIAMFGDKEHFRVFSDDIEQAQKLFDGLPVTYYDQGDYLENFRFMKRYKHFIIANSSFSAMAAHLGEHPEKKVVAPKLWFGEQANGMPTEDIYDKNWVVI